MGQRRRNREELLWVLTGHKFHTMEGPEGSFIAFTTVVVGPYDVIPLANKTKKKQ